MQKQIFILIVLLLMTIPITAQTPTPESTSMPDQSAIYTYHQATGNRIVQGTGTFPDVNAETLFNTNDPRWIIGTPDGWQITNADNTSYYLSAPDSLTMLTTLPAYLPNITIPIPDDASELSHPVAYEDGILYVTNGGDFVYLTETHSSRLALNIQADARIVISDDNRIAVYANATNQRYVHAIMGDDIEGASLIVLTVENDELTIVHQVDLAGDAIYEGLSPMWADVNEDGVQDLITTVSDSNVGSRIRMYLFTENAVLTVDGQAIGQPNRWQHQLAWGAFGENGENLLVEVLTPHIGGVIRFYQFTGSNLDIIAQRDGYTSHIIGSRNLDMAIAGDFNGDGQLEIVLPSQDRTRIAGLQMVGNSATVVWEFTLDSPLATNLAARLGDNGLELATGTENGTITIWQSQE